MGFWKRLTQSLFASFLSSANNSRKGRKNERLIKKKNRPAKKRMIKKLNKGASGKRLTKGRSKPHRTARQLKPSLKQTKPIERPKQKTTQVPVGQITHYFPKIQVAVLQIKKGGLLVMDPIRIEGKVTNFNQTVGSMQIDRKPIEKAIRGDEIGLQVREPVQPGDIVFKLKS